MEKHINLSRQYWSVIAGTGSYIPSPTISNADFLQTAFYDEEECRVTETASETVQKLEDISGIKERRYLEEGYNASDMGAWAAAEAISNAGIDPESIDYLLVAHNFGDVPAPGKAGSQVPSIAARIKQKLGIRNPFTICYDTIYGCPGWLQCMIQGDYYLRSGEAKSIVVVGTETLARVGDPHDRNSMLFGDSAGAVVLGAIEQEEPAGIIAHASRTDAIDEAYYLWMARSNNPNYPAGDRFLKMKGKMIHRYALEKVPELLMRCLEKARVGIHEISGLLLHQANGKMVKAIADKLFRLYGMEETPPGLLPMCIERLGNTSVATLPTLLSLIHQNKIEGPRLNPGSFIALGSVGAGMCANGLVYKVP